MSIQTAIRTLNTMLIRAGRVYAHLSADGISRIDSIFSSTQSVPPVPHFSSTQSVPPVPTFSSTQSVPSTQSEWRRIPGFSRHEATSDGRIRHRTTKMELKGGTRSSGVRFLCMTDDSRKNRCVLRKRIIAMTFLPNDSPVTKTCVWQRNRDQLDCSVKNLEWVTRSMVNKRKVSSGAGDGLDLLHTNLDLKNEEWRDIPVSLTGGKTGYRVSTLGRIKRPRGVLAKVTLLKSGYTIVSLDGKTRLAHRVVATVFLDNPEGKRSVNHINGDKKDNRVCNLEWCTQSENVRHAYDTGLNRGRGSL